MYSYVFLSVLLSHNEISVLALALSSCLDSLHAICTETHINPTIETLGAQLSAGRGSRLRAASDASAASAPVHDTGAPNTHENRFPTVPAIWAPLRSSVWQTNWRTRLMVESLETNFSIERTQRNHSAIAVIAVALRLRPSNTSMRQRRLPNRNTRSQPHHRW